VAKGIILPAVKTEIVNCDGTKHKHPKYWQRADRQQHAGRRRNVSAEPQGGQQMSPRAKKTTAGKATKKTMKKTVKKTMKPIAKSPKKAAAKPAAKPPRKAAPKAAAAPEKKVRKRQAESESSAGKSARSRKSAVKSTTEATMEAKADSTKRKKRKQTDPEAAELEDLDEADEAPRSSNGTGKKKGGRGKKFAEKSLTEEYLEDGLEAPEDEDLDPELVDLDPLDAPVVLDPELDDEALLRQRQAAPKPKKLAPRTQVCRNCGKDVTWTSTDRLCFNCLKRNIAQKRNDETYGISEDVDSGA
jgi:hypothetical protein